MWVQELDAITELVKAKQSHRWVAKVVSVMTGCVISTRPVTETARLRCLALKPVQQDRLQCTHSPNARSHFFVLQKSHWGEVLPGSRLQLAHQMCLCRLSHRLLPLSWQAEVRLFYVLFISMISCEKLLNEFTAFCKVHFAKSPPLFLLVLSFKLCILAL